jgi:hypothetical protein
MDKEKFPLNNSLVVGIHRFMRSRHYCPLERENGKKPFPSAKYGRRMVNREVIVECKGRGDKQWINLNR